MVLNEQDAGHSRPPNVKTRPAITLRKSGSIRVLGRLNQQQKGGTSSDLLKSDG